jgi:hypothetical protein
VGEGDVLDAPEQVCAHVSPRLDMVQA